MAIRALLFNINYLLVIGSFKEYEAGWDLRRGEPSGRQFVCIRKVSRWRAPGTEA